MYVNNVYANACVYTCVYVKPSRATLTCVASALACSHTTSAFFRVALNDAITSASMLSSSISPLPSQGHPAAAQPQSFKAPTSIHGNVSAVSFEDRRHAVLDARNRLAQQLL